MEDDTSEVSASSTANELFQSKRSLLGEQSNVDSSERCVDRRFLGKRRGIRVLGRSGCRYCLSLSCRTLIENALIIGIVEPPE